MGVLPLRVYDYALPLRIYLSHISHSFNPSTLNVHSTQGQLSRQSRFGLALTGACFHPETLVTGKKNAASNYVRDHYAEARK